MFVARPADRLARPFRVGLKLLEQVLCDSPGVHGLAWPVADLAFAVLLSPGGP